ncbi:MAG: glycoside hydrolase family 127 protein [Clostridia bacterium]|nr:glycoside hydrolase family 127 protein [Clostridia bacterium]
MRYITEPVYASFGGDPVRLAENVTRNWLIGLRESNPALLDMFAYDDDCCVRDKLSWSGEYPGKYITSCCAVYRLTGNRKLLAEVVRVADELISYQKENGYLGIWGRDYQLTGFGRFVREGGFDVRKDTWDAWSHYHIIIGLIRLYDITRNEAYFGSVLKIADLFCRTFYGQSGLRLGDTGCLFANLAPIHAMAMLYNRTGERKYLDFALEAEKDIGHPDAIDFIGNALAGREYWQCRGVPRWEYIHAVEALAELYIATGDDKYKTVFTDIWRSIQRTDVHNTGAFSTFEQAMGTPYIFDRAIETCCVVAHTALTIDMLALTNDPAAADQLEKALYNTTFGSFNPTGRWSTYNTPMMGYKRSNSAEIQFQCKPGAPDLNCCSVNAPRPLGEIAEWAYRTDGDRLFVNYYGQSEADWNGLTVSQRTGYPYADRVRIRVTGKGTLMLRVPAWSAHTRIRVNGKWFYPQPGYFPVDCRDETSILLNFDFTPRIEYGHEQLEGKRCVRIGPVLICHDASIAGGSPEAVFGGNLSVAIRRKHPGALYDIRSDAGSVTLCDLILAGNGGSYYTTWF